MRNETRPIGDVFTLTEHHPHMEDTHTRLEVREGDGNCTGCYLKGWCMNNQNPKEQTGLCSKTFRSDGKNVIFAKIGKDK